MPSVATRTPGPTPARRATSICSGVGFHSGGSPWNAYAPARTRGELEWAAGYLDRIRGGAYAFQGEPPLWNPTPEQLEVARAAGVGPWVVYAMADEDT